MYKDDIISKSTQEELERVCRSSTLSLRADMEYMIYTAVHDAYKKGYEDGKNQNKMEV